MEQLIALNARSMVMLFSLLALEGWYVLELFLAHQGYQEFKVAAGKLTSFRGVEVQ